MEIIILALFTALTKLVVLGAILGGVAKMLWWTKAIDILMLFVLPALFYGTFSGMLLAIFSGLWLCLFLMILKTFIKPVPPSWTSKLFRYGKKRRHPVGETSLHPCDVRA